MNQQPPVTPADQRVPPSRPREGAVSSQPAAPQAILLSRTPATPTVTYTLLTITVLVYLAQMVIGDITRFGVKSNELIAMGQIWRLVTPMFLHGSILHIGFNMYALFVLGPGLERYYGHGRFLALYGLSGFAGNVMSMMFSLADSLGASTAIFGLIGAQGVFVYQNQKLLGPMARRALTNIITIALINLMIGMSPQIDNWGHIGGLIGGTLFAWFGGPVFRLEGDYPAITLRDTRSTSDVIRAGLIDWLIFAFLAVLTIFLRL